MLSEYVDALDVAVYSGLLRDDVTFDEGNVHEIAGFNEHTTTAAAIDSPCQIAAGFLMHKQDEDHDDYEGF